jgi:hypothetical protein
MVCVVLGLYILSRVGTAVRRWELALSIRPDWVGSTRRLRQNPVSKTLRILNKSRTMANIQKHSNWNSSRSCRTADGKGLLCTTEWSDFSTTFPAQDVWWVLGTGGMIIGRGEPNFSDRNLPECNYVYTNFTWTTLGLNPEPQGKK